MKPWRATHVITHNGRTFGVMFDDNRLYSVDEWEVAVDADWEIVGGRLLFQGQVPAGNSSYAALDSIEHREIIL